MILAEMVKCFLTTITETIIKNMLPHMMSTMPQQNMKLQNLHTRRKNPLPFQYINLQCTKNLIEPCHLAINNFAMAFESVVFFDQEGFHLFYYSRYRRLGVHSTLGLTCDRKFHFRFPRYNIN